MYSRVCALSVHSYIPGQLQTLFFSDKPPPVKYNVVYTVCFCLFDNQMLILHIHGVGGDFIQGVLCLETFIHSHHLATSLTVYNTTTTFLMIVSHFNRVQFYGIV